MPSAPATLYRTLADLVLVAHFGVVLFVIGGLVLVWVGNGFGWNWVNRFWFRALHLAIIALVILQAWLGQVCPLTTLESWLRQLAGLEGYEGGFIQHWVGRCMFYEAPLWVFGALYLVFGLLVAFTWWRFPPRRGQKRTHRKPATD